MIKLTFKLVVLFILYYLIQFGYSLFGHGFEKEYIILNDNTFEITELYTANKKSEIDNYYISISVDENEFALQTYHDFGKKQKIVSNVHYYKDNNYKCIFPEFIDDVQLFDVICKNNDYFINYSSITNKPKELVEFVNNIEGYKAYTDTSKTKTHTFSTVYVDNIPKNHYISLSNYKGIDLFNSDSLKAIMIFVDDVYKRPISSFVGKYYITADYEKTLYFDTFRIINIETGNISNIYAGQDINLNSYVMGSVDNLLYILDKTNKIQYEIDIPRAKVTAVGNMDSGVRFYENGKWKNREMTSVIKEEKKFIYNTVVEETTIYKNGNKLSGHKYYFTSKNNTCDVYRTNVQDDTKKLYLFTMSSCNNRVFYLDEYIYFVEGNKLKYYSDMTGIKTILENNELIHNKNILVGGYVKSAE